MLAVYLGMLELDFEVTDPLELVAHLRARWPWAGGPLRGGEGPAQEALAIAVEWRTWPKPRISTVLGIGRHIDGKTEC
jgi:hypothetical protein